MIVQELLKKCIDVNKLIDRYFELYYRNEAGEYSNSFGETFSEDALAAARERATSFYNHLVNISPVTEEKRVILYIAPYIELEGDFTSKAITTRPSADVCIFDGGEEFLSPMFVEWNKVMGWNISNSVLEEMDEYTAVAHIMWELSFCGYTEEEQQEERTILEERVKEADEHPERLISVDPDHLFEHFGYKDERSEEEKSFTREVMSKECEQNEVIRERYLAMAKKEYANI